MAFLSGALGEEGDRSDQVPAIVEEKGGREHGILHRASDHLLHTAHRLQVPPWRVERRRGRGFQGSMARGVHAVHSLLHSVDDRRGTVHGRRKIADREAIQSGKGQHRKAPLPPGGQFNTI